jgi:hypothetical protein
VAIDDLLLEEIADVEKQLADRLAAQLIALGIKRVFEKSAGIPD